MKTVWVELGLAEQPIRIFRSTKAAFELLARAPQIQIVQMSRSDAVSSIRHQLYVRSEGKCEIDSCGAFVIESSGHMHETKHRGKGGEVSMMNSVFICVACHGRAHADRAVRWTKKS